MADQEKDVAPEMLEKLLKQIDSRFENDKQIQKFLKKEIKTGFRGEASLLCEKVGKFGSDAFIQFVLEGNLPNGELYWNIAERTYIPMMEHINDYVNQIAMADDKAMQKAIRTNIKPTASKLDEERVKSSLEQLLSLDADLRANNARRIIPNVTQSMYDDFVKLNIERKSKLGLESYIVRIAESNCCDWCAKLEGRYRYKSEPQDVYHRHDKCRCTVEYYCTRGKQNVWNRNEIKQW